jgi:hypothetical protein
MTYIPAEHFRSTDFDRSSYPVRDCGSLKQKFSLNIFPGSLEFVGVVDVQSPKQAIIVQNDGYEDLAIHDVIVVGPFQLIGEKPTTILAGNTISIEVAFTAKVVGAMSGGIFIQAPLAVGECFVQINGTGSAAP